MFEDRRKANSGTSLGRRVVTILIGIVLWIISSAILVGPNGAVSQTLATNRRYAQSIAKSPIERVCSARLCDLPAEGEQTYKIVAGGSGTQTYPFCSYHLSHPQDSTLGFDGFKGPGYSRVIIASVLAGILLFFTTPAFAPGKVSVWHGESRLLKALVGWEAAGVVGAAIIWFIAYILL